MSIGDLISSNMESANHELMNALSTYVSYANRKPYSELT